MAIAAQENQTRSSWHPWGRADHLQLLIDKAGYQPTPWEQARLDAIAADDPTENGEEYS
jgi:hypothetical protein